MNTEVIRVDPLQPDPAAIARELSRAVVAYIGAPSSRGRRASR